MRRFPGFIAALGRRLESLGRLLEPLGLCGKTGVLAGLLAGFILMLDSFGHGERNVDLGEGVVVFGLLASFAYVVLLFLLTVLERFTFASVALPALINVLLVVGVTVAIVFGFDIRDWAMLVGAVVGALVGSLLCQLNRIFSRGKR